jgi:hypothetical protein
MTRNMTEEVYKGNETHGMYRRRYEKGTETLGQDQKQGGRDTEKRTNVLRGRKKWVRQVRKEVQKRRGGVIIGEWWAQRSRGGVQEVRNRERWWGGRARRVTL